MKKYLYILLIFNILFCEKNSNPVGEEPTPIDYYNISGRVFYVNADSLNIENAQVIIGNRICLTDKNGHFEIDSILKGINKIKIFHPNFNILEEEIDITQDTTKNFQLTIKIKDYFPLNIGNEWEYTYSYEMGNVLSPPFLNKATGTKKWKIINKIFENDLTKYQVEDIFNGTIINGYANSWDEDSLKLDTTYAFLDTNYFTIAEDSLSNLKTEGTNLNPWHSLPRYYSSFEQDTLDIFFGRIKYAKDIGIIRYYENTAAITYYLYVEYSLLDYNIVDN